MIFEGKSLRGRRGENSSTALGQLFWEAIHREGVLKKETLLVPKNILEKVTYVDEVYAVKRSQVDEIYFIKSNAGGQNIYFKTYLNWTYISF